MRATRLSRLLPALSAALSQVGRWETPNAAYKSEGEPFDTYGLMWRWGVGKTSLAGTLYGRVGEGENVEFWNFRIYWHPGTREARVDQWVRNREYTWRRIAG